MLKCLFGPFGCHLLERKSLHRNSQIETYREMVSSEWSDCRVIGTMEINLSAEGSLSDPKAAYIHVPFCHSRCPYCNFTVVANRLDLVDRYVEAVSKELTTLGSPRSVKTIFIGGGTPTLLPREPMERLFEIIRRWRVEYRSEPSRHRSDSVSTSSRSRHQPH